jgi:hypothetical protein
VLSPGRLQGLADGDDPNLLLVHRDQPDCLGRDLLVSPYEQPLADGSLLCSDSCLIRVISLYYLFSQAMSTN